MSAWAWVGIGLGAWLATALAIAPVIGKFIQGGRK